MAISTALVQTSNTSIYTSTDNSAVTFMSLCNNSGTAVNVSVYLVPSGDGVGVGNIFIDQLEISAHDTYIIYQGGEKIIFSDSDGIVAKINTGNNDDVTAIISYMEGI